MTGNDRKSVALDVEESVNLLDIGIGVFDSAFRLNFCNPAFRNLRGYPDDLCRPGVSLHDLLRYNAQRGDFGPGDVDAQVALRLGEIGASGKRSLEHKMADGQVLSKATNAPRKKAFW